MIPVLLLVHKILLIITAAVVGCFMLFYLVKALSAVLVSSKECFKSEPYYSGFLLLLTSVSTLTGLLEILKK